MDKLNIKINKNLIKYLSIIIFLIFAITLFSLVTPSRIVAYASADTIESVTSVRSFDIVEGVVTYSEGEYLGVYSRNVKIHYYLPIAAFYKVDVAVDGNGFVNATGQLPVPSDDRVTYTVTQNGEVEVRLNLYNESREQIGTLERTVYSDNVAPTDMIQSVDMTKFCKTGEEYHVNIDCSATDDRSGMGDIYYSREGGAVTRLNDTTVISDTIDGVTDYTVYYFDRAYNCVVVNYTYDKYDDIAPPTPTVEFVRGESDSDLYAPSYAVEIDYGTDGGSGIVKKLYSINGGQFVEYTGSFSLTKETVYTVVAYSVDGVGNLSEKRTATLSRVDPDTGKDVPTIDATAPTVVSTLVSYDLTAERIATVRIEASDVLSGVKGISAIGGGSFSYLQNGLFEYTLDCFGQSSMDADIYDKAGNKTTVHVIFEYFGNRTLSDKIEDYVLWYRKGEITKYNEKTQKAIRDDFVKLNNLLVMNNMPQGDFDLVFRSIDAKMNGSSNLIIEIESAPSYLSGVMTYSIVESDFLGYIKGDEIKLILTGEGTDNEFLAKTDFKKGFCDNFSLDILFKGTEVNALENGIVVRMNMPVGFYERNYALFDRESGEKIEIRTVNNKIEFTLKKSSSLSLVISGESEVLTNAPQKTVSIFGHELSLGVFLGTVLGGVGVIVVGVLVIIILSRRKG